MENAFNRVEGRPRGQVFAIVGPTAVGKSALAVTLAEKLPCIVGAPVEIVSADSRQVYRGLDVGTAKPTADEQARVPHHCIDVVDPEDDFTLAEFQDHAYRALDSVLARGGIPLLVGGTGLYVKAVVEGTSLPRVPPDLALRAELEGYAGQHGPDALHRRLAEIDPKGAARIDPRNVRRVIRAIEVTVKSGMPFSHGSVPFPRYEVLTLGVTTDRATLYRRIDERIDQQLGSGLIEETQRVLDRGCSPTRPALRGFGYRQIVDYLEGRLGRAEAVERFKFETHRFARQQYAWFRPADPRIRWLDAGPGTADRAIQRIVNFCARGALREVGARS
jgi:tRNA dimethylallyltransferase